MLGGFKTQGKTADAARALVDGALALEAAGCVALVLEAVPAPGRRGDHAPPRDPDDRDRRRRRTATARCSSTTTCSASPRATSPRFVKRYATSRARSATRSRPTRRGAERRFPGPEHTYAMPEDELEAFRAAVGADAEAQARYEARVADCRRTPAYSAFGSTANAATITPASASAPTTPRHGSAERRPQPERDEPERPGDEREPDPDDDVVPGAARRRPSAEPVGRRTRARSPGRARRARARAGSAAKPSTWRAIRNGASTPTAFAPSQSASPSRKYPAAP